MEDELENKKVDDNSMYIDEINKLKETTVPKDKYDKLKADNKKLLASLVNGEKQEDTNKKTVDIEACRNKIFSEDVSNVEFCQSALDLRNTLIEQKGIDIFLPRGREIRPTEEDCKKAQNVADVLQDCLEQAEGNNEVFTGLLNSRIAEDSPALIARLKMAKLNK